MAEATTPAKKTEPKSPSATPAREPAAGAKTEAAGPHVVLRALIGLAGIALLIGFFLPWLSVPSATEGAPPQSLAGYNLAMQDVVGTPGVALWALPVLGLLLAVTGFMGFRWAGQVAIAVGVAILGYSLYVLLQMFVQHTALGLWIVAGSTFVVLLLGVIAWMVESRKKATKAPDTEPAKTEPAKAL